MMQSVSMRPFFKISEYNHHDGSIYDIFIPQENNQEQLVEIMFDLKKVQRYGVTYDKYVTMNMVCTYTVDIGVVYAHDIQSLKKHARRGFFYNYMVIDGRLLYTYFRDNMFKNVVSLEDRVMALLDHRKIDVMFHLNH